MRAKQGGRVALLSGGVGGARLARGLAAVLAPGDLTIIVNVGDDDTLHGVHVSPDIDTVLYTVAGLEGPEGWGRAGDTSVVMDGLDALGVDTTFRIGDADLAMNLARSGLLAAGAPLSTITARMASALGVGCTVVPATDDAVRTKVMTTDGEWLAFQEYFVIRGHRDDVAEVVYSGADGAKPAPGVEEAIATAGLVVIAPSNPPLSIWPILAIPGIREAIGANRAVAVSPLFGGSALKGPAHRVMASLGMPAGNAGVLAAYDGLLRTLVIDQGDIDDRPRLEAAGVGVLATDTRIAEAGAAAAFARWMLDSA